MVCRWLAVGGRWLVPTPRLADRRFVLTLCAIANLCIIRVRQAFNASLHSSPCSEHDEIEEDKDDHELARLALAKLLLNVGTAKALQV